MDIDREYERERAGRDRERSSRYDDARRDSVGTRKRSATPPVKKREPTPDLTDIVPILQRKRRLTMWDIKPQGYENVTAEQAKLSGRPLSILIPFNHIHPSTGISVYQRRSLNLRLRWRILTTPINRAKIECLPHYQLPVTRPHNRWYMEG